MPGDARFSRDPALAYRMSPLEFRGFPVPADIIEADRELRLEFRGLSSGASSDFPPNHSDRRGDLHGQSCADRTSAHKRPYHTMKKIAQYTANLRLKICVVCSHADLAPAGRSHFVRADS